MSERLTHASLQGKMWPKTSLTIYVGGYLF